MTNCTCVHIVLLFCCSSLVKFTFVLWWEVRVSTVYLLFTVELYYTCINLDSPMSLDVTTWIQISTNTNTSCLMWFGRIIAALWCCRKCCESEDVDLVLISQKTYRHLELVTILWCLNECCKFLYKPSVNLSMLDPFPTSSVSCVILSHIHLFPPMFCHYISCVYSYKLWNVLTVLTVILSHFHIFHILC